VIALSASSKRNKTNCWHEGPKKSVPVRRFVLGPFCLSQIALNQTQIAPFRLPGRLAFGIDGGIRHYRGRKNPARVGSALAAELASKSWPALNLVRLELKAQLRQG
jgi:hypothetical protein